MILDLKPLLSGKLSKLDFSYEIGFDNEESPIIPPDDVSFTPPVIVKGYITDNAGYNAYYGSFEDDYMKDTDLYRWLVDNCTDYGFVLRYPEGKEAFYGVACNHPAHFRYVGKEAAKYMKEHDLCLEEFIMLYDESKVYLPQP